MYAVVDVETTGGSYRRERIIELAIVLTDGKKITGRHEWLVNPERPLHYFITKLTGIKNSDLKGAPIFSQISEEAHSILEGKILVAHPAKTDYQYLKQEYKNIGQSYHTARICTLKLCQTLFPELTSTNLTAMCEHLGVEHKVKHRALGDAEATALMFHKLTEHPDYDINLAKSKKEAYLKKENKRLPFLKEDTALPEETGVYYMKAADGEIIYVDHADDIWKRIMDISSDQEHYQSLLKETAEIEWTLTGNKLISELRAEQSIREIKPKHNKLNKHQKLKYGLFSEMNKAGFKELLIKRINYSDGCIYRFKDKFKAENFLWKKVRYYNLCAELCGLTRDDSCELRDERGCSPKCKEKDPVAYNKKVDKMMRHMDLRSGDFIILGEGLEYDSKSAILIQNYHVKGYAYVPLDRELKSAEDISEELIPITSKINSRAIVKQYLHDTRKPKVINF